MKKSVNYGLAVASAVEVADWIEERWPNHLARESEKNLAMACFSIAKAHHRGILVLIERDARTAATALLRPLFEATIRGQWFRHCANRQRLRQADEEALPNPRPMTRDLADGGHCKALATLKSMKVSENETLWQMLCDYAHGGKRQIGCWFDGDTITECHTDLTVMRLLEFANLVVMIAALGAVGIAGRSQADHAQKLQELTEEAHWTMAGDVLDEMLAEVDEAVAELFALYERYKELTDGP